MGDSEDTAFWTEFLRSLGRRGLSGVKLVISDAHAGLRSAIAAVMQGASWQRCRVHFARNLLARVHKGHGEMVAALFRTVFAQTSPREVAPQLEAVAGMFDPQFPTAASLLREAGPDLTAFADFPRAHWKKIWSTNPLERLNREIKRRADVVGVFPNPAALERLAGAILAEQHDEWNVQDERRYLSEASMAELYPGTAPGEIPTPLTAIPARTA